MQVASVKENYLFNTLRTVLLFLAPLITFPYVSRVLGPASLGKVEFANSIVSYFVLFTALGIPTYGAREIARVRDDVYARSRTVWELSLVLAVTVAAGYVCYFIVVRIMPVFRRDALLFLIVSPAIALSGFSYEWFYTGIENQRYITVRSVCIKAVQVICIFALIHSEREYYLYAGIAVGLNSVSAVCNIARLRRYMVRVPVRELHPARHLRPVFVIFASIAAVNVYTQLDVTMLGIFAGDAAVGLYTAANRIVRVVIQVVTSLGVVMIPRMEHCASSGDRESYRRYAKLSLRCTMLLSLPCCAGIACIAPELTAVFAGNEYAGAAVSVRLLSPIIVIVGLAHFVGLQILYTNRKEHVYAAAVSIAAVVNAACNYVLISRWSYNGAVVGTLIAEITGLAVMSVVGWKYIRESGAVSADLLKYAAAAAVMSGILYALKPAAARLPDMASAAVQIAIGCAVYSGCLLILRDDCVKLLRRRRV